LTPPSLAGEVIFRLFAPYLSHSLSRAGATLGKKLSYMFTKTNKSS